MSTPSPTVLRWSQLRQSPLLPDVTAATRLGAQLSASLFELGPNAVVPRHSHPNEEFGQVIVGSIELTSDAQTDVLSVGEAFLIPGDMPHSAVAGPNGCRLLECYAPPRDPQPASTAEQAS